MRSFGSTPDRVNNPGVGAQDVVAHVKQLLRNPTPPEMTPGLSEVESLPEINAHLLDVRNILSRFATGDFTPEINLHGVMGTRLKSLQANIRHLLWQIARIEAGDLNQRVEFIGDFAAAFNSMVQQLDTALTTLRFKETQLLVLSRELELELERRTSAMNALEKSEEKFRYLAEHDPLTGVLNRRSFFARAEKCMSDLVILKAPSSVAIMDVDHFKNFNDTHGHQNGDKALKHIVGIASSMLRPDDVIGRFGGEEFVFLFASTTKEQAVSVAERIRKRIELSPMRIGDASVTITVSFGVTSIPSCTVTKPEFSILEFAASLADSGLYQAKFHGRNRVSAVEFPKDILRYVCA